jgi:hypothetical protein
MTSVSNDPNSSNTLHPHTRPQQKVISMNIETKLRSKKPQITLTLTCLALIALIMIVANTFGSATVVEFAHEITRTDPPSPRTLSPPPPVIAPPPPQALSSYDVAVSNALQQYAQLRDNTLKTLFEVREVQRALARKEVSVQVEVRSLLAGGYLSVNVSTRSFANSTTGITSDFPVKALNSDTLNFLAPNFTRYYGNNTDVELVGSVTNVPSVTWTSQQDVSIDGTGELSVYALPNMTMNLAFVLDVAMSMHLTNFTVIAERNWTAIITSASCLASLNTSNVGTVELLGVNLLLGVLCSTELPTTWNRDVAPRGIAIPANLSSPLYAMNGVLIQANANETVLQQIADQQQRLLALLNMWMNMR